MLPQLILLHANATFFGTLDGLIFKAFKAEYRETVELLDSLVLPALIFYFRYYKVGDDDSKFILLISYIK
jgi:hypothetical protein